MCSSSYFATTPKGDRTNGSWSRFIKTATERYISNMAKIESTLFATLINNSWTRPNTSNPYCGGD